MRERERKREKWGGRRKNKEVKGEDAGIEI